MTNFSYVSGYALSNIQKVLNRWLPHGKWQGNEYVSVNPTRLDNCPGSFKINGITGAWADFATNDKGCDLVSLVAYLDGITQGKAAERLASALGIASKNVATAVTNVTSAKSNGKAAISAASNENALLHLSDIGNITFVTKSKDEPSTAIIPIPGDSGLPLSHHTLGAASHLFPYKDGEGRVIFYICRFETMHGARSDKEFRPASFWQTNQGQKAWRWVLPPVPRPLYNLDKLLKQPDKPVLICEGEKSADAAAKLLPAFVTTTTLNGAQSPHKSDFQCLQGREVYIWPDNDEAGKRYGELLEDLIAKVSPASIKTLNLERFSYEPAFNNTGQAVLGNKRLLPEKWDAADALKEGYTNEHLKLFLDMPEFLVSHKKRPLETQNASLGSKSHNDNHYLQSDYTTNKEMGVCFYGVDNNGEALAPRRICSNLAITALTRDEMNDNWGRLLEFEDRDGVPHKFAMPMELMSGDGTEYRKELLRQGLEIEQGKGINHLLANYINRANPEVRAISTKRVGWHQQAFVFPHCTIGEAKDQERILFQSPYFTQHHFKQKGDLDAWRENIGKYCVGNSRLMFAVSAAFAAPLLHLLDENSGGFNFTGHSSCGKSTALRVAASVYGDEKYMQRWRATANGLEGIAAMHNDTLLILDELAQVDPKEAGEIAYMLANGQGKVRAHKNGLVCPTTSWRMLFLSAGEVSLAEHMLQANKKARAGQEIRLIDIPAEADAGLGIFENLHGFENGARFSQALIKHTASYHGTVGMGWLELLTEIVTKPEIIDKAKELQQDFIKKVAPNKATGQVMRVASSMAVIAVAGTLATGANLTGWSNEEAVWAVERCFNAWIEKRGGVENQEEIALLSQVRAFMESYDESHFMLLDDCKNTTEQVTRNRAGVRSVIKEGESLYTVFFIFTESFRQICQGFDPRWAAKILIKYGWLEPGKNGHSIVKRIPGIGPAVRCYKLNNKLFEG